MDLNDHFTSSPQLIYQSEELLTGDITISSNRTVFAVSASRLAIINPFTGLLLGQVITHEDPIRSITYIRDTKILYISTKEHVYQISLIEADH